VHKLPSEGGGSGDRKDRVSPLDRSLFIKHVPFLKAICLFRRLSVLVFIFTGVTMSHYRPLERNRRNSPISAV
jgi:hypothetical protein